MYCDIRSGGPLGAQLSSTISQVRKLLSGIIGIRVVRNTDKLLTKSMHEFPREWHPEMRTQRQDIRYQSRENTSKIRRIGGKATECARAENTMRIYTEQIVGSGGQVSRLDQPGWEIIPIVYPPYPVTHPFRPVGEVERFLFGNICIKLLFVIFITIIHSYNIIRDYMYNYKKFLSPQRGKRSQPALVKRPIGYHIDELHSSSDLFFILGEKMKKKFLQNARIRILLIG